MHENQTPVLLTQQQIALLQDYLLEKQYMLAAKQPDSKDIAAYRRWNEHMSHTTDVLLALDKASADAVQTNPAVSSELDTETRL